MIFNRTQDDVDASIDIIKNTRNAEDLTFEQRQQLERGTLTINTLNRIENKQTELKNLFNSIGYYNVEVDNREWTYTDYFFPSDFARILINLESLKKAFFVYSTTPIVPDDNYRRYQTINAVEKNLYDLDAMINDIKSRYRQCGTFQCGEVNEN
jgi:transcriptional regulator with XRE-family HTH domain